MMKIVKINWIDESQQDADITISDGVYSITCFSSPCILKEGEVFKGKLYAFDVENVYKAYEKSPAIVKGEGYYEYFIRGELELRTSTVQIGELLIDVSDALIPKDISGGEMIELKVNRFNIY